ncbi:DUF2917 domain-containing protein [Methylibium petroleiphilum]|uniref:DUF2917 domain-containing protein n=1 Tax=Methylibium petroleiphilum TaxID=105560 RepID=UPI001AC49353|nr:DUF2917 domain-containing protein [Methylibium petroleiphilum]MBN9204467.1 DUF2917 domain-containing protein [Methylibium petroleiphilum]
MSMQQSQESMGRTDPVWRLVRGQTLRLQAARNTRWLRLREGRLWVTAQGRLGGQIPEDWWLAAGQSLRLPAGTEVLAEGWSVASFEVLEEPAA